MRKLLAFIWVSACLCLLLACGMETTDTADNTDTADSQKYYIPVIVLNEDVYAARGEIVNVLPEGYIYAGELTEEEKQYAYIDGSKYYIRNDTRIIEDIYVYQECGTPTSPAHVDNMKRQWAYVKWEIQYPYYFIGKITGENEWGSIVELIDYGTHNIPTEEVIIQEVRVGQEYSVGDYIRVEYETLLQETDPPQIPYPVRVGKTNLRP